MIFSALGARQILPLILGMLFPLSETAGQEMAGVAIRPQPQSATMEALSLSNSDLLTRTLDGRPVYSMVASTSTRRGAAVRGGAIGMVVGAAILGTYFFVQGGPCAHPDDGGCSFRYVWTGIGIGGGAILGAAIGGSIGALTWKEKARLLPAGSSTRSPEQGVNYR